MPSRLLRPTIEQLADRPDCLPIVAAWIYEEWWTHVPGANTDSLIGLLRSHLSRDRIPLTLIASVERRERAKPASNLSGAPLFDCVPRVATTPRHPAAPVHTRYHVVNASPRRHVRGRASTLFALVVCPSVLRRLHTEQGPRPFDCVLHVRNARRAP